MGYEKVGSTWNSDSFQRVKHRLHVCFRCTDIYSNGQFQQYEFTCAEGTVFDASIRNCLHIGWRTHQVSILFVLELGIDARLHFGFWETEFNYKSLKGTSANFAQNYSNHQISIVNCNCPCPRVNALMWSSFLLSWVPYYGHQEIWR